MNKIFTYLLLLSFAISGCDEAGKYNYERNSAKILTYCDSFVKANPNPTKNDLIQEKIDKNFASQFKSIFERNLFDDYLLSIQSINEYSPGKFSVILQRAKTDRDRRVTHFDLIALTDKKTAFSLDKRFLYTIRAEFVQFNPKDFQDYDLYAGYTPEVSVNTGILNMGIMLVRNTEFIKSDKKFIP